MATDEKDRFGDKLHDKEKAEEDSYFAAREREALDRLRQQRDAAHAPAAPEPNRSPRGGTSLVSRENDSWLGRLFTRPKR